MTQSLNFLCLKTLRRRNIMITTQLYKSVKGGKLSLNRELDCSCDDESDVTQQSILIVFCLPCLQNNFNKVKRPDGRANLLLKVDVIALLHFKFFLWRRQSVVRR